MEKKQTAVEWFIEVLKDQKMLKGYPVEVIEQALQMEKEQLFYSFEDGYDEGFSDCRDGKKRIMNVPELRTKFNSLTYGKETS